MTPFRKLNVWAKAHELVLRIYGATEGSVTRRFPALVSQLRRAAASIPANVAEGAGYDSDAQFNRHLEMALASAREVDYHLLLARDLGAVDSKAYAVLEARVGEVQGMLLGLQRRVLSRIDVRRVPPSARVSRTQSSRAERSG